MAISAAEHTPRHLVPPPWRTARQCCRARPQPDRALPVITVLVLAFLPAENIWPHMLATVLPGYVWRTLLLMAGVGALSFVIGTGTAWLVTMCRFPARKVFQWALLVPLALPTYIVAYTYVDFLTYAGPLQGWLRALAGWKTPHDYWFPEIRSIGGGDRHSGFGALSLRVPHRAREFPRQSTSQLEVARTLGRTAWGAFFSVALPSARPAIAVGVSLAMMECLNDIGAAGFFGVRTCRSASIRPGWREGNLGGAAQIAAVMLIFVFAFLWIERAGRQQQTFAPSARKNRSDQTGPSQGLARWPRISCLCASGPARLHRARRHPAALCVQPVRRRYTLAYREGRRTFAGAVGARRGHRGLSGSDPRLCARA